MIKIYLLMPEEFNSIKQFMFHNKLYINLNYKGLDTEIIVEPLSGQSCA